jgi:SAM-dependent methyltransferase
MNWVKQLFVEQAKLYALVLEGRWETGEETARAISDYAKRKHVMKARILDVPCGIGRVANPLAKYGFEVVGVDLSPFFIKLARNKARTMGTGNMVSFFVGDMQRLDSLLKDEKSFDIAVNTYNSLGYGSVAADLNFFRSLRSVIREKGHLMLIELLNRDWAKAHVPARYWSESQKLLILESNVVNLRDSKLIAKWRFYRKYGNSVRFKVEIPQQLRMYSPGQINAMLTKTGWTVTGVYGDFTTRKRLTAKSPTFSVVARAD